MFSLLKYIDSQLGLSSKEKKIQQAIRELNALSDHDLNDLGLSRDNIKQAVRYGRKSVDFSDYHAV